MGGAWQAGTARGRREGGARRNNPSPGAPLPQVWEQSRWPREERSRRERKTERRAGGSQRPGWRAAEAHTPRPRRACRWLPASAHGAWSRLLAPESLTWDLLGGLLPGRVGAAPSLGQKGRRTAGKTESRSLQSLTRPLLLLTVDAPSRHADLARALRWTPAPTAPYPDRARSHPPHRGAGGVSVHLSSDAGEAARAPWRKSAARE